MLWFARFLIASMFLTSAFIKIFTLDIQVGLFNASDSKLFLFLVVISIIIEIVFSIMLIIDYKIKLAIIALIIFLIANTIMVPYKFPDTFQVIIYKKNLAILGGLIVLYLFKIKTDILR